MCLYSYQIFIDWLKRFFILFLLSLYLVYSVRCSAFSTGFKFLYDWPKDDGKRLEDHIVGDAPLVKPVFKDLKTEVMSSGCVGKSIFDVRVVLKAKEYLKSEKVRKMSGNANIWAWEFYKVTLPHLCAIICYCDLSSLCTKFSATYRRNNVFETMESVLKRHSKHFGNSKCYGGDSGPFYCGIDCVLNIGSFAVCFNGPCSTSMVQEVALNFAGDEGIILKVDNDGEWAQNQKFLDCSFISCFIGEAERLWICCGDQQSLRIVSIKNVLKPKNYEKKLRKFYIFDLVLSGAKLGNASVEIKQFDVDWLSKLISLTLSGGDIGSLGLDDYLQREWRLFLQNKREITLRLNHFDQLQDFKLFAELIMENVVKTHENKKKNNVIGSDCFLKVLHKPKGKDNVIRTDRTAIFPSFRVLTLMGSNDYRFRLPALLGVVQLISSLDTVILNNIYVDHEWVKDALTDEIVVEFKDAGWCIEIDYEYGILGHTVEFQAMALDFYLKWSKGGRLWQEASCGQCATKSSFR